jgi:tRNA A37 threonylcarbamoyladenosine dehydratase
VLDHSPVSTLRNIYLVMEAKTVGVFVLGAAAGVALTALMLRKGNQQPAEKPVKRSSPDPADPEYLALKQELLVRVYQYFGEEKMATITNAYVVVLGVGGVGSNVVNMLVRSGVRRLRIVDFDRVSLSSLSRHAYATLEDVGTSKVQCMKKYINKILMDVEVEAIDEFLKEDNLNKLVPMEATYVIDCIDNIDAKTNLVAMCFNRKQKLMVSGGAGMKNDVTRIQIRDISETKNDELMTALRRRLGKLGIKKGVMVAHSQQEATKELLPLNVEQKKDPSSFQVFENYRIRIIPVLGTMPIALATAIASYVLCDLCGEPYEPYMVDDVKSTIYQKIHNRLLSDERKMGVDQDEIAMDIDEVYLLMRHIFEWKCFMTGKTDLKQYYLTRWDMAKPVTLRNSVVLCREAYDKHISYKSLEDVPYAKEMQPKFDDKLKLIEEYRQKRHINYR